MIVLHNDLAERGQRLARFRCLAFLLEQSSGWDSPSINHFLSADTIVPGYANPQNLNRYSYVRNNPLKYTDPTGHGVDCGIGMGCVSPHIPPSGGNGGGNGGGGNDNDDDDWDVTINIHQEYHIGGAGEGIMPLYYGETENSANVPYFTGGNQPPYLCTGRNAIACLISLGAGLIPYHYGPANNDANFSVALNVNYNESVGVTMSDIYWANRYSGQAVLGTVSINDMDLRQPISYMPSDGSYRPIENSGGIITGNDSIVIKLVVTTVTNSPNGPSGWPQSITIPIPSLPEVMDFLR